MNDIIQRSAGDLMEQVIIKGDLANLAPADRAAYYNTLCQSLGLNPLTQPFRYLMLDGKLTLYATKDCTEQLRKMDKISVTIVAREAVGGAYIVTARASTPDGRVDESIGAVPLEKESGEWANGNNGKRYFKSNGEWVALRGVELANAMMKAETKSKRRVTLSICGLGMLDETEVETIPNAVPFVEAEVAPMPSLPLPNPPAAAATYPCVTCQQPVKAEAAAIVEEHAGVVLCEKHWVEFRQKRQQEKAAAVEPAPAEG